MDLKQVEELVELMRQSGVLELSLELPDYKISIKRGAGPEPAPAEAHLPQAEEPKTAPAASQPARTTPIISPVVGIFHNGGMLDPKTILCEGDRVQEGQLLAAIENMKVPNDLRCPVSGTVQQVLVEDGAPVEYGQTLFLIQPQDNPSAHGDGSG